MILISKVQDFEHFFKNIDASRHPESSVNPTSDQNVGGKWELTLCLQVSSADNFANTLDADNWS